MAKGPKAAEIKKFSSQTLKTGSKGPAVECLQNALNAEGGKLGVDGKFGSGTKKAVQAFQKKKKLSADGIVGPNTWGAISGKAPPKPAEKEKAKKQPPANDRNSRQGSASDPNSCTVIVKVRCPGSSQKIQGAEVKLGRVKGRTDSNGDCRLTVPAGRYDAKLKKSGYDPVADRAQQITAIAGGTLEVKLEMRSTR